MEKRIRVVKKSEDDSNIQYWLSLSGQERLRQLEEIRQEVNRRMYGTRQEFQRVYRVIKRSAASRSDER
jgi:hypothetical protein